ncbi:allophanate hydrolase [Vibrio sp. MACH09]|uniref:5-oxoprolinase subunit B family protein n=1 Tax=unclassified Vibrio TaxID=2614977 RepID=UPI001493ACE8|nr:MULTISPECIES: allophanate hydrolase subunit 1 [unclassified Vibrio]NOI67084.1 allophanate hydrolase subunit 1 [Vibrio sp. 99-8-1]GLO63635.1 allophanate hydrolase [Vibrio sp. MACH09]
MLYDKVSIEAVCESSILIRFSDQIQSELPHFINLVSELIYADYANSIMNLTPSYTTLLIDYLPYRTPEEEMLLGLAHIIHQVDNYQSNVESKLITLPVYYHDDVAPDLAGLLKEKNITKQQLIKLHTQTSYKVCAIGFSPGFGFLSGLNETLAKPRLATPRLKVIKGSVGIADNQTAVYPSETPGGWNIIGNCPTCLFDADSEELSPLRIGDTVQFEAIEREQFLQLGGQLWHV